MAKKINYASLFTLRKDGRYQGYYTDSTGRHCVCDRDPEKLYQKIQDRQNQYSAPIITFQMVAEEWERQHREQIEIRTWKNYEPHYKAILEKHGDKPFEDVTGLDAENHLKMAKTAGFSRTVVNSIRSIYNMIFDYAVVHGYTRYNPVKSVKLPKGLPKGKRTAPTDEQINVILRNVNAPFGLFAFLLLCTGMRRSEALCLQWSDIDFVNKQISVTKSRDVTNGANPKIKMPKTEAGIRTIPMVDILVDHMKKAYRQRTGLLVFPAPPSNRGGAGGGLITERGYEGLWDRYCEAVGFVEDGKNTITAHNLRHGTATLMFELGVDELTAQKVLGHSRIEITREIYTELRNKQKSRSISKLNRGMAKMMAKIEKAV